MDSKVLDSKPESNMTAINPLEIQIGNKIRHSFYVDREWMDRTGRKPMTTEGTVTSVKHLTNMGEVRITLALADGTTDELTVDDMIHPANTTSEFTLELI